MSVIINLIKNKNEEIKNLKQLICLLLLTNGGEIKISNNLLVSTNFNKLKIQKDDDIDGNIFKCIMTK